MAKQIINTEKFSVLLGRSKRSFGLGIRIDRYGMVLDFVLFWVGIEW